MADEYRLTREDCQGLMLIRGSLEMFSEFAQRLNALTATEDFKNQRKWLDGFMDRIGATEVFQEAKRQSGEFKIPGAD